MVVCCVLCVVCCVLCTIANTNVAFFLLLSSASPPPPFLSSPLISKAWAKVSGKDIPSIMSTWTEQMGFPLVKVEQVEGAEGGKMKLKFTQSWFLAGV